MNTQELKIETQTTSQTTSQTHTDIIIYRTFDMPLDMMWNAWTKAETLKKWWGPKNFSCPAYYLDLNDGGKYLSAMKDKKDGKVVWSTGNFIAISPERKLVMTDSFSDEKGNWVSAAEYGMPGDWPKYLIINIDFKEKNNRTEIILKQGPMPIEMADDCVKGWHESFDKLEEEV